MNITTKRLRITQFLPEMAQVVHENSLDDDTRRFLPDEVFETVDDAADTINYLIGCYSSGEGPLVYPVLLHDGTNIGYVQAVPLGDDAWEIGYHIAARYTKNGYATEAVTAFAPEIMRRLDLTELVGVCLAENLASVKVLEQSGFYKIFEGNGEYQGKLSHICKYLYTL